MLSYVIRRLLYSVAVLIAASFLVFFFVTVSGDPLAPLYTTPNVDRASIDAIADRKNINDPIPVRYLYWVRDAVTNEFGTTLLTNKPILPDLWRVMKNTLQLVLIAQALAILVGVGIGILSALRQYFALDRAHHLVMPVIVLMVAGTATYSRYMRASMLEVINSDYVRTARAKGLNN